MPENVALSDEDATVDITASETVFSGRVHTMVRETFDYNGEPLVREFIRHPGAVAVLVLDDDENVLLILSLIHI